jgi:hypothetical protein
MNRLHCGLLKISHGRLGWQALGDADGTHESRTSHRDADIKAVIGERQAAVDANVVIVPGVGRPTVDQPL